MNLKHSLWITAASILVSTAAIAQQNPAPALVSGVVAYGVDGQPIPLSSPVAQPVIYTAPAVGTPTTITGSPQVVTAPTSAARTGYVGVRPQVTTSQGYINPYAKFVGVNGGTGSSFPLNNVYDPSGSIDYRNVLQQGQFVGTNHFVNAGVNTDMTTQTGQLGRNPANYHYNAERGFADYDRTQITSMNDAAWQSQYAVTSENTRPTDYQNRTSGWRLVTPEPFRRADAVQQPQPAPQPVALAAPAPVAIENIYFGFDSDIVKVSEMDRVRRIASILAGRPNLTVVVTGHTDKAGSNAYNEALSKRRSNNAAQALVDLGIDPSRIGMASSGELDVVAGSNKPNGEQALNRRVTFTIFQEGQQIAASEL